MLLSFVVPAYNVAPFVERCLRSILSQPFGDFEIVIIDDGSTDETGRRIEEVARSDARVRPFRQENAGQGAARNFGLTQARGDYVWFVDADDWLAPHGLPRLALLLSEVRPDVLVINFETAFEKGTPPKPSQLVPPALGGTLVDPRRDAATFEVLSCWCAPPWRLISRREFLLQADIAFAIGVFYEDHPFAVHVMLAAQRVFVDAPVSYAYFQRASSTTKVNDRKAFDFLLVRAQCLELFRRFGQYERLAPVVISYLVPLDFYRTHVAESYRAEFIRRLAGALSEQEAAFVQRLGSDLARRFAAHIRARDTRVPAGPWRRRWVAWLRGWARRILPPAVVAALERARQALRQRRTRAGAGVSPLTVGIGARMERHRIDVRVRRENRAYVIVGEQSHVAGDFIFERGLGTVTIGKRSSVGGGCMFVCSQDEGIRLGDNVMLAWNCTLIDTDAHSLDPELRANDAYDWKCGIDAGHTGAYKDWSQVRSAPIVIEDGVWLGFETAVMKGVRIGCGAVIGARSLVTNDVPAYCVYAGNPARFVRLVARSRWSWEEIVEAFQHDPAQQGMLEESYLHRDLGRCLSRFRASDEFRETLAQLRRHAPGARRLLDVGGAAGVMSVAFALEGYEVTLLEPSGGEAGTAGAARLLAFAAAQGTPGLAERVRIVRGRVEDFDTEERFDVVYCRQVVHHFADPAGSLRCLRRLLRPGGIAFFVREHVVFDDADRGSFLASHPFHRYTGGEAAYRPEEYCGFIAEAGLKLVQQIGFLESPINTSPHDPEYCRRLGERSFAGRPYSFLACADGEGD